jgi:SAM-dependent methyltransferase
MTSHGQQIAESWKDPAFATSWHEKDPQDELLALPRALAPTLVADEGQPVRTVLDIASGPGTFLARFLDKVPEARGICTDASPAMLDLGRAGLERFGDRVSFQIADMTDVLSAGLPTGVDVVLSSRATHHLDPAGLARFYADVATLLGPDGWIFNLDHASMPEPWLRRMKTARKHFIASGGEDSKKHFHVGEPPTADDHLRGLAAAGLSAQTAWQAFRTFLFAARRTA